ncbi:hypothetical protein PFICI_11984 [Pestalotiopsis fici W106-1]|uniref:Uncharacterized protein n=1 Tax=Pestalotiopsis fici (strain W106-1 / CGMCC3.15140) TaxID=1229662 RepID=W3WTU6_PESFW|nr:uncharacterized protein PFICI_11984 [Pestalotiopsis fici W106-1]ETS76597.1 hypothetical protein PFICI_11984 [Pestalotiopsis fici W106-1]
MEVKHPTEPIAITGFSFRMPQDAIDESGLWNIMEKGLNVKTKWPASRSNPDAFHDNGSKNPNTLPSHYAHFMKEDPGVFDAPFFSITPKEAASMSPRQRQALEVAYHTFESAGIPMEDLRGSLTAVYGASMADDWTLMSSKDAEMVPRMSITGNAASLLPNKISWFFDLRGPSVHVDTACSSGLTALDLACQSILSGNAKAALVFGSSTLLTPEASLHLANLNFLSPDGCCYSFDSRANGYGRGEGVAALYLKPLRQAVNDGDVVRAIVRGTASNQDGRTPGLTQPSSDAQIELIRHTYAKAGLDLKKTRYVEAHGTGTPMGDPLEARACGRTFGAERSPDEPLYLGSIKANIGHLEGSSGPAGVIKAIMMLERGIIPPQALFESLNPAIDAATHNIKIPTAITPWPEPGVRRISINSFGFGGANAHAILDDAVHYMRSNNLQGFHHSTDVPELVPSGLNGLTRSSHSAVNGAIHGVDASATSVPQLLVWSAVDEPAIQRMLQSYAEYYTKHITGRPRKLAQLAYTLAARRSIMSWRSFAVLEDDLVAPGPEAIDEDSATITKLPTAKPLRVNLGKTDIAFVFTGQGAQYAGMGLELLHYPIFAKSLQKSDEIFNSLGSEWSLLVDAIKDQEKIATPEYSQPLCTALQIALVDLLRSFNILPAAVVGHSSGEIAAAYTSGALSHHDTCKVAYLRGKLAGQLARQLHISGTPGAMLSANLSEDEVPTYLENLGLSAPDEASVCLACVNSPKNVTLAGPADLIDTVKADLDKRGVFAQKLNTGLAYHSPAMRAIAQEYASKIGPLEAGKQSGIRMISSVSGKPVQSDTLASPQYWVDNLVSTVQFAGALKALTTQTTAKLSDSTSEPLVLTDLIEIGPHAALRRPIKQTAPQLRYHALLQRSASPLQSTLHLVGSLFCLGYPVSVTAANGQDQGKTPYLIDCPAYPFDHSRRYWDESRLSKDWRLREGSGGFLLGRRTHDWNPLRPRWRNLLCVENAAWLGEHHVTGTLVVPGTGSLVIALEAARDVVASKNRKISGFNYKNVELLSPLRVGRTARDAVEMEVHLDQHQPADGKESTWFQFRIFSHSDGRVTNTCTGQIQVLFEEEATSLSAYERKLEDEKMRRRSREIRSHCTQPLDVRTFYKRFLKYGFRYGPSFTVVSDTIYDPVGQMSAAGKVNWDPAAHETAGDSPVHPGILDGILQVLLATAPKGLKGTSTMIPRRIEKVWLSNRIWSKMTNAVHVASALAGAADDGNPSMNFWALADDDTPLCSVEGVQCTEISRPDQPEDELVDRRLLYSIDWKPRLSSLAPGQLQNICDTTSERLNNYDSECNKMAAFFPKVELALRSAAKSALHTVPESCLSDLPSYFSKYIDSLRWQGTNQSAEAANDKDLSPAALEALLQECEVEYPQWHLFPAIARALPSILRKETDPLELMFGTGAAKAFYTNVYGSHMLSGGFQTFISLAAHENPRLRILEVGAGTGSFTRHILSTLHGIEKERGGTAFEEYVFTDISTSFFANAQTEFKDHLARMSFKPWNVEHDAGGEQGGLEAGSYDIIFAGSVLHATSSISKSLRHLRKLLKPGGHLVLQEITSAQVACVNIAFGTLEGWWLSAEKWRQNGPLVTQEHWNRVLKDNGFQGIGLALKDFEDDAYHISTIMVSRASDAQDDLPTQGKPVGAPRAQRRLITVNDQESACQTSLATELGLLGDIEQIVVNFATIGPEWTASPGDVVVCLIDVGSPRFADLSEQDFKRFQWLIQGSKNLLWVGGGAGDISQSSKTAGSLPFDPRSGIATGALRTIRSEESHKRIVSLIIDQAQNYEIKDMATFVAKILDSCFAKDESLNSPEVEFAVQDGHITIGRLAYEKQLDDERESHARPHEQIQDWSTGPMLALEIEKPGMLDSLRFVEDPSYNDDLADDDVEIDAEAWPVSFRDVFSALGKVGNGKHLGWECAGIVTRVGSESSKHFKPGERVVLGTFGSIKTRPRSKMQFVFKIPDNLSSIDAVSHVNPGMTAWHGLVNLARLQKGEKVLIHSAAGATGQMAMSIATMIGAEIYATVGSDEKKQFLQKEFNIPETRIFQSRDTSFAQGIARTTNGQGVDVILNSLAGEGLQASWECIAPFGRFIEIGKVDIMANASLPMGIFAKNVTFAAVDLVSIVKANPALGRQLLASTMELVAKGSLQVPKPLHLYPIGETEKALRFMQSGSSTGRIIITKTGNDQVTTFLVQRSEWRFESDATYVIVGGLGGLGRVIIDWMVSKGARNFLVPSRSGASSQAASDLVARLRGQDIYIATPKCDVSSAAEFSKVLREHTDFMPHAPIKGCINSAMALQDAIFSNMTHDQWSRTIQSKVQSSLNLHNLLAPDVDFFIMLSSLVGIYGAMGQSNYAAGCSFQDALARARTASKAYQGTSVSLDLGWLLDAGIVSEREDYRRKWEGAQDIAGVGATDLIAVLDHFCDPARHSMSAPDSSSSSHGRNQLLVGAVIPADLDRHGESIPPSMHYPLFDGFRVDPSRINGGGGSLNSVPETQSASARFRAATSFEEKYHAVIDALRDKLARGLDVELSDVDIGRPVSSYGVDSLMAVELRNWMRKDYNVDIAVFDILGGTTVTGLSRLVATRADESANGHGERDAE